MTIEEHGGFLSSANEERANAVEADPEFSKEVHQFPEYGGDTRSTPACAYDGRSSLFTEIELLVSADAPFSAEYGNTSFASFGRMVAELRPRTAGMYTDVRFWKSTFENCNENSAYFPYYYNNRLLVM